MRKVFLVLFALIMCLSVSACVRDETKDNVLKIDFAAGQQSAIFSFDDKVLYPSDSDTPAEHEYIQKTVVLEFENATKVGLEFLKETDTIVGLMFSVDGGDPTDWAEGEFFSTAVQKIDTKIEVVLRVWLSPDTPLSEAGKTFSFTIKALAE